MRMACVWVISSLLIATPALAQLSSQLVVSGLSAPVAVVQDPTQPNVQFVVEQGGKIRVVRDGALLPVDFLDLTPLVLSGGERGLLGLAFAPDYATSRRFFVNYTRQTDGHTVISRYLRSVSDPVVANPASRVDLRWPDGNTFIVQPFANHNGGDLQFGSDGFLYIPLGDGGGGNDPAHRAQNPAELLGKMLRIDVNVPDADAEGYDVPPTNPFVGQPGVLPEIWAFGLRNPFRVTVDAISRGGTGAIVIGDVGQATWEEIDYEPFGEGGRNYGWSIREGAHDNVTTRAPAFTPLIDPIAEYSRAEGNVIIGGVINRGTRFGSAVLETLLLRRFRCEAHLVDWPDDQPDIARGHGGPDRRTHRRSRRIGHDRQRQRVRHRGQLRRALPELFSWPTASHRQHGQHVRMSDITGSVSCGRRRRIHQRHVVHTRSSIGRRRGAGRAHAERVHHRSAGLGLDLHWRRQLGASRTSARGHRADAQQSESANITCTTSRWKHLHDGRAST